MLVVRRTSSLLGAIAALLATFATPLPALAHTLPTDIVAGSLLSANRIVASSAPSIDAAGGILETGDGHVLWARGGDIERPMASTTKMMTALVALRHGHLDQLVTVSAKAASQPTGAGLRPGQRLTERQLLSLMLVRSANDAAWALGEGVAGTMPAFVRMMNDQAAALGLKYTHYANPHGLDAPGHFSTPADLATLARVVMAYPEFRRIATQSSVSVPGADGRGEVLSSTDRLLGIYPGLEGGKTGYTDGAGYCFVGAAKRNGVSLIAVVLNTDSPEARFSQTARLLDWGFAHVSARKLASAGERAGSAGLVDRPGVTVEGRIVEATTVPVFDLEGPVVRRVTLDKRLITPVFEGQPIGDAVWTAGRRVVARSPVVAGTTVGAPDEVIGAVPVSDFTDTTVDVEVGPLPTAAKFDPGTDVRRQLMLLRTIQAPVAAGQQLGRLTFTQGGHIVATVPIVAARAVAAPGLIEGLAIWWTRQWDQLVGGRQMVAERHVDGVWAQ